MARIQWMGSSTPGGIPSSISDSPHCSTWWANASHDCAISSMLAFDPGSESCWATAKQSAEFRRYFVYRFICTGRLCFSHGTRYSRSCSSGCGPFVRFLDAVISLLGPTMGGSPMPLPVAVRRQRLSIIQFSTPKPPLRHPEPYRSILWSVRKLGHALALGGEPHEFLRGIHWNLRIHGNLLHMLDP
jgi:hypothetical protein